MPAGDMNKLIDIIGVTKVGDGMGGYTETDYTIASDVWAAIWPVSANERVQSMQTDMVITHRIRIRYRSVFWPSWRIKFGHRYFNVDSVLNTGERNEWLDIMAKEST